MATIRNTSLALAMLVAISAPVAAQVDVENADTDRVPMHTVIPDYPEIARRDRIEGDVQVCFNISRRGYPRRIGVRHSTNRVFEKVAMKAVRKSRWQPLAREIEMSGIKACRTFRFSLVPVEEDPHQS